MRWEARNKATADKIWIDTWEWGISGYSPETDGYARVFHVNTTFLRLAKLVDLRDVASATPVAGSLFGFSVASTHPDETSPKILVGAPQWAQPPIAPSGAVFVFDATASLQMVIKPTSFASLPRQYDGSLMGWSLSAGQLTGSSSSAPEVLIGLPQFGACPGGTPSSCVLSCPSGTLLDRVGRALLFELGTSSATLMETYQGESSGGRNHLGFDVAFGDFDGEGDMDPVLSALGWSLDGNPAEEGRMYVFHR